jgi:hypothetical protein
VIDKRVDQFVIQFVNVASTTRQPLAEVPEQPPLRSNRRGGVPATGEISCERVDVRADAPRPNSLTRAAIPEDLIQHASSIPGQRAVKKKTAGLCRLGKRPIDRTGAKGTAPALHPA